MLLIVLIAVFIGMAAASGGILLAVRSWRGSETEDRLGALARSDLPSALHPGDDRFDLLASAVEGGASDAFERYLGGLVNLRRWIDQSGVSISPRRLLLMIGSFALLGALLGMSSPIRWLTVPLAAALLGALPLAWLYYKRRQRLNRFEAQFPEAVDLLARSLRAGHSLADGIGMIGTELNAPIRDEFRQCYEQQNLGIPLEEAMEQVAQRVPNVDLRFFVTVMVMQRETGGDLVELLEKISRLIRERFQLRGQVKALTGEGRLSGIVLLALPVLLTIYMYFRSPDYLMLLFQDSLGRLMVGTAVIAQVLGAVVIKKIVDIRV